MTADSWPLAERVRASNLFTPNYYIRKYTSISITLSEYNIYMMRVLTQKKKQHNTHQPQSVCVCVWEAAIIDHFFCMHAVCVKYAPFMNHRRRCHHPWCVRVRACDDDGKFIDAPALATENPPPISAHSFAVVVMVEPLKKSWRDCSGCLLDVSCCVRAWLQCTDTLVQSSCSTVRRLLFCVLHDIDSNDGGDDYGGAAARTAASQAENVISGGQVNRLP